MGSTSVHFPDALLAELDHVAAERGVSRNRLIVDSCRSAVRARKHWPDGFFSNARFSSGELAELQGGAAEFAETIARSRRNRRKPPL
jgi:predicted transcriptional regulator